MATAKKKSRTTKKRTKPPALDTFKGSRDYFRDLRKIVQAATNLTTRVILGALNDAGEVKPTGQDRLDRVDAIPKRLSTKKRKILAAIARAEASFARTVEIQDVQSIVRKTAGKTDRANRQQVFKQARAAIGITKLENPSTARERGKFVKGNVRLIKTIGPQHFAAIRKIVDEGFQKGTSSRVLKKSIQAVGGVTERRAALIARDQIGSLNAQLTKTRHTANGFDSFLWTTVGDERVRDEHEEINGQEFSYATGAPGEGFPGDPIACRCFATPVFGKAKK